MSRITDPKLFDRTLYCDDCYASRGYGYCGAHQYLWEEDNAPQVDDIKPQGEMPKTRRMTLYVYRDKDSNWGKAEEIWGDDKENGTVRRAFAYTLFETAVDVEIDLATGRVRALGFAGIPLQKPTDWGV
jgi:hypothetical protein